GPAVHADADGHASVSALARDKLDVLGLPDVAGVQAQAVNARLERSERHLVLVVDIGDDRHRGTGNDAREALGGSLVVARAPDDVGAGRGERIDLRERAIDVARLGDRHRLHAHGRVAADGDWIRGVPEDDLTGLPARERHCYWMEIGRTMSR